MRSTGTASQQTEFKGFFGGHPSVDRLTSGTQENLRITHLEVVAEVLGENSKEKKKV